MRIIYEGGVENSGENEAQVRANHNLFYAILNHDSEENALLLEVMRLVEKEGADVNCLDDYDNTPLMHALSLGFSEIAKYLISKGAKNEISDENKKVNEVLEAYKANPDKRVEEKLAEERKSDQSIVGEKGNDRIKEKVKISGDSVGEKEIASSFIWSSLLNLSSFAKTILNFLGARIGVNYLVSKMGALFAGSALSAIPMTPNAIISVNIPNLQATSDKVIKANVTAQNAVDCKNIKHQLH